MQKFRLNITSTVHNQILLLKIPFIRITRPQLLHIRSFATEIPEKTTNSGYTTKKDEFVNENLDSDTVQTSQSASTNVKTAEELKNEAEKARKRLEEMKDVEMLFQKFLLRGLRATVIAVLAFCLLIFAVKKKAKDVSIAQYKVDQPNPEPISDKERAREKLRQLEKEMEEGGYPMEEIDEGYAKGKSPTK